MINNKKRTFLLIICILLIALLPRLYCLRTKGLFSYDEAYYLLEAKFFYSLITHAHLIAKHLLSEPYDFAYVQSIIQGIPPYSREPLHNLLIALMFFITGVKDYAPFFLSLIFSILIIWLVYLLGKAFYNSKVGIIAALILSVSEYFLMYSRSGRGTVDSIFFFLLGIYFFYLARENKKPESLLMGSGLSLALCILCNWKWLYMLPIVFLLSIFLPQKYKIGSRIKHLFYLFSPVPILMLIVDLPFRIFLKLKPVPFPVPSYLDLMFSRGSIARNALKELFTSISPHFLFFGYLWDLEGPLVFIILFSGIIYLLVKICRNFSPPDIILLSLFLLPFVAFSMSTRGDHPRAISITLPFIAIIVALTLERLSITMKKGKVVLSLLLTLIVLYMVCTIAVIW